MVSGGVLVVASLTPEAWGRRCDPLVLDMATARPLHAQTWASLMARSGFGYLEVHRGGPDLLSQLHSDGPGAPVVNEGLVEVLETLVGGPDEYVVTGVLGAPSR
jgi:hypothetical protein